MFPGLQGKKPLSILNTKRELGDEKQLHKGNTQRSHGPVLHERDGCFVLGSVCHIFLVNLSHFPLYSMELKKKKTID